MVLPQQYPHTSFCHSCLIKLLCKCFQRCGVSFWKESKSSPSAVLLKESWIPALLIFPQSSCKLHSFGYAGTWEQVLCVPQRKLIFTSFSPLISWVLTFQFQNKLNSTKLWKDHRNPYSFHIGTPIPEFGDSVSCSLLWVKFCPCPVEKWKKVQLRVINTLEFRFNNCLFS